MTAMEMQAEVLSTLAILVPLMAFIYSLHRGQCRRFELLEQRMDHRFEGMDRRFDAIEQRMDQRFDAMHGRIDALARPQIKLVNR
jgi:hypothetical protein